VSSSELPLFSPQQVEKLQFKLVSEVTAWTSDTLGVVWSMATLFWEYFTEDPLDESLNKEFDRSKLSIKMSYNLILVFMHLRTILKQSVF